MKHRYIAFSNTFSILPHSFFTTFQDSIKTFSTLFPDLFRNLFRTFSKIVQNAVGTFMYAQQLTLVSYLKHMNKNINFDRPWSISCLVSPPTVRGKMRLSCVPRWSNTEKTVSSKVETAKTVNAYYINEYSSLTITVFFNGMLYL